MIGRLALRSLTAHPVRSAVLAAGFGFGVSVMAILLGVADIVLEQAQSPALVGGGDVRIRLSRSVPARLVLSGTLQSEALRPRIRAAAGSHTDELYLLHDGTATQVRARGGIPSAERELDDPETAAVDAWRDSPGRPRLDSGIARPAAAADRPVPRGAGRAAVGRFLGRVALLQRARRRHPLLSHVPGWTEDEWRQPRGRCPAAARAPRTDGHLRREYRSHRRRPGRCARPEDRLELGAPRRNDLPHPPGPHRRLGPPGRWGRRDRSLGWTVRSTN